MKEEEMMDSLIHILNSGIDIDKDKKEKKHTFHHELNACGSDPTSQTQDQ